MEGKQHLGWRKHGLSIIKNGKRVKHEKEHYMAGFSKYLKGGYGGKIGNLRYNADVMKADQKKKYPK